MPAAQSDAETARRQLDQVLASGHFARSEQLSRLLRFLVERHLEGRGGELKESVIAVEVFGRKPDYQPRHDPIVRTEARRLRARLSEYYRTEGKCDRLVIELPKGGYTPLFREAEVQYEISATRETGSEHPQDSRSPQRLGVWVVVILAAIVTAIGWWSWQRQSAPIPIAVLPLKNLNQDPADDYFADGLTGEIIRNLAIIDGLAVRSQTSSFVFKGKPHRIRDAAQQLRADYILEGSVFRAGRRLRIDAQLIRTRDDSPLWSGRYDRELTDVLAIQDEISRGIVNSLRLKLGRGRRRYETSVEAYDLYLRARSLLIQPGFSGYDESVPLFEQAIAKDPSFAPAYAGLAVDHAMRSGQFRFDISGALVKMRQAAQKAVELDPLSAEAYEALALAYDRDAKWKDAEQSYRRAFELEPNRSTAHDRFAMDHLLPLGRIEEALHELRIAERSDPLSPEMCQRMALALLAAGRYQEAAAYGEKLPAGSTLKSLCMGRARLFQGRTSEAIQLLRSSYDQGFLGYAYGRTGRIADAETLAARFSSDPLQQALTFAGLGDKERTLAALESAIPVGAPRLGRLLVYPEMAFLRGDPRLKELRQKVGLPEQ